MSFTTPYFKNDTRIIRIETNPNKQVASKFNYRVPRVTAGGDAIRNEAGFVEHTDVELTNAVRVPTTKKTISPCRLPNGRLNTGLDVEVENPYKDEISFRSEIWQKVLKDKPKVLLQHLLEYEHNTEFDYYTSDLPRYTIESARGAHSKFFTSSQAMIHLNNNTTILHMNNPIHRVRYYTILAHKAIANSYKELEDNFNADWYIVDEDEREVIKQSAVQKDVYATGALAKLCDTKNGEAVIKMAKALEISEANDKSINEAKAQRLVYEYYKKGEVEYQTYKALFELWNDKVRRPEFNAQAELFDMIRYGLISYKAGKYVVNVKGDDGGILESKVYNTKLDVVMNFLLDPVQKDIVTRLRTQLESQLK